jgi:hypothetical protein
MNSNPELQNSAETIYQLLDELYTCLSVLEQQIQSGSFPAQLESNSDELALLEDHLSLQEDNSAL